MICPVAAVSRQAAAARMKELFGVLRTSVAQVVDSVIVRAVESLKEVESCRLVDR